MTDIKVKQKIMIEIGTVSVELTKFEIQKLICKLKGTIEAIELQEKINDNNNKLERIASKARTSNIGVLAYRDMMMR